MAAPPFVLQVVTTEVGERVVSVAPWSTIGTPIGTPPEPADPARTTVVVVARDLGRQLPARWQAEVGAGCAERFDPWLRERLAAPAERPPAPEADLPGTVRAWQRVVPAEQVVVLTVPRHGLAADVLRSRYAVAAGLPADSTDPLPAPVAAALDDAPLSGSQAHLMRAVNEALLADGYPVRAQQQLRERLLGIWRGLGTAAAGARLTVPAALRAEVRARAEAEVRELTGLGVRVVGPVTDLEPLFGPATDDAAEPDVSLGRDVVALLVADRLGAPPSTRLSRVLAGSRRLVREGRSGLTGALRLGIVPAPRVTDSSPVGLDLGRPLDVRGFDERVAEPVVERSDPGAS